MSSAFTTNSKEYDIPEILGVPNISSFPLPNWSVRTLIPYSNHSKNKFEPEIEFDEKLLRLGNKAAQITIDNEFNRLKNRNNSFNDVNVDIPGLSLAFDFINDLTLKLLQRNNSQADRLVEYIYAKYGIDGVALWYKDWSLIFGTFTTKDYVLSIETWMPYFTIAAAKIAKEELSKWETAIENKNQTQLEELKFRFQLGNFLNEMNKISASGERKHGDKLPTQETSSPLKIIPLVNPDKNEIPFKPRPPV